MKDNSGTSLLKFGTLQKLLIFICGGGWMISNAVQVSLGILLDQIHEQWGISYILQSLVSIGAMIGSFTGCFFWGILADRYGRRPAFTKVLLFIFLGLIISDFSPNIWMLAPCYIIVGFGLGGSYTVDGNVFLEYCPHNKQYLLTSLSALSSFGSCFPPALILIYKAIGTPYLWQFVQGTLGLIALLISIPRFWIKETPAFLLSKHKTTEVFELIHQMSPLQDKESLLQSILEASPTEKNEEKPAIAQLKCLFRRPFRKLTLLYLAIWCGSSFTFTGVSSFLPVILKRAGFSANGSGIYLTMLLQQLAGIPGILLSTYIVKTKFGRKRTLAYSQLCGVALIFGFLLKDQFLLIILSVLYFFFENSFLAVQFCITPESFPPEIRNTALGLFTSSSNVGSIIAPFLAAVVLESTETNLVFILVMATALMITGLCSLAVIETRNFQTSSWGELDFS